MSEKKLFLIDAFAIIYRSYFAFGNNQRYNSQGLNTSAMLGFTNTIIELLRKENPTHIGVVFDSPGKTFREDIYPLYKAHRDEMPEDIRNSIPYIKKIIEAMNIPLVAMEGFEADDIIGTMAKAAEKEEFITYMMTPDKDFMQLVTDNIIMYKPGRSGNPAEKLGVSEVLEKFEINHPEQVIDILGLWGDAADNIPGIPGIGEKTSKKLISKYGTIENLIEAAEADLKGKQRENVINFAEQGLLSKKLATIVLDVPIKFSFEDLKKSAFNKEALLALFAELEFRGLAQRIFDQDVHTSSTRPTGTPAPTRTIPPQPKKNVPVDLFNQPAISDSINEEQPEENIQEYKTFDSKKQHYQLVESIEDIKKLVAQLGKLKSFCFDTETTGLDSHTAAIIGLSFSFENNKAFYVPVAEGKEEVTLSHFRSLFENENIEKIAQNIKYDMNILKGVNIKVLGPLFDTMIAHYLLEPDMRHNMDLLSETYLSYRPISIETLIGKKGKNQLNMRDVSPAQVSNYACEDADITWQLKGVFEKLLKETETSKLFCDIEMPLIPVLSEMESEGVKLDSKSLENYAEVLKDDIDDLEKKIIDLAGEEFNVSSPKQLGEVLFDKLKITDKAKKTKTGQYQTNEETLQKLADKHEIIAPILEYRQLKKLKSTYVDVLPTLVNPSTGKIHTSFNQAVAATGRLSSNNPNLQNIPIKTEKGREVRRAFVASEGREILAADYSQVELRVMAEICEDKGMQDAFMNGQDIHAATAANVFDVPLEEVDKAMRNKAKMVNFGIIYGISAFGLSQRLGIPRKEAAEIIKQYFMKYPGVQRYMNDTVEEARKNGYVQTIMGRKRYLKDINSRNAIVRGYAERNAINAPIQGSAADIIKKAMIDIQKELKGKNYKSTMILQVHDELLFDVVPEEKEKMKQLVKDKMENAVKTNVPLEVDMNYADNWLDAH
ncbi:MAG: DNA polymerase-1 [Saprospiraceae bacterium]|jgi:DNA polymerase-1